MSSTRHIGRAVDSTMGTNGDLFAVGPRGWEAATMGLLPGQCRWPIGDLDDPDFHFCDSRQTTGKTVYCDCHEWDARQKKRGKRPASVRPDQNRDAAQNRGTGKKPKSAPLGMVTPGSGLSVRVAP